MLSTNIEFHGEYIEGFSAGFRFAVQEMQYLLRKEGLPPETLLKIESILASIDDSEDGELTEV